MCIRDSFLLGLVNGVTKDKIAAIDAEKTRVAMSAVVPELSLIHI